jgi:hypothetical protein
MPVRLSESRLGLHEHRTKHQTPIVVRIDRARGILVERCAIFFDSGAKSCLIRAPWLSPPYLSSPSSDGSKKTLVSNFLLNKYNCLCLPLRKPGKATKAEKSSRPSSYFESVMG